MRHLYLCKLVILLTLMIASCGDNGRNVGAEASDEMNAENSITEAMPEPDPEPAFTDVTAASGIAYEVSFTIADILEGEPVPAIPTNGVAAGDYDNDGDVDLFIVRGDIGPNLLYRNDGDLVFTDVAEAAGVALLGEGETTSFHIGPVFADIDGDGDLDLFLRGLSVSSLLLRNNGDGTFTDITDDSGLSFSKPYGMSSAFGDYDLDGDLDLVTTHWGSPQDRDSPGDTEHLWRNDSVGSEVFFTSVSESSGIAPIIANLPDPNGIEYTVDRTFTPTFARINDDLFPDLLMVADFNQTQYFTNNGDGTFDNATDVQVLIDGNGMGSAVGDYDNDGDLDWFVTSILYPSEERDLNAPLSHYGNRLYQNQQGVFSDVTDDAGVSDGGWGWGACFIDFENDGDLDIYHTNGWQRNVLAPEFPFFEGYRMDPSRAFVNGSDGTFDEQAQALGLSDTAMGRGVVCADFDNDGDTDILLMGDEPILWRNNASGNQYLKVRLVGSPPNTEASGARITLTSENTQQLREISIGSNFLSQNPAVQLFGLGADTSANITITWPDGSETGLIDVASDQTLEIVQ